MILVPVLGYRAISHWNETDFTGSPHRIQEEERNRAIPAAPTLAAAQSEERLRSGLTGDAASVYNTHHEERGPNPRVDQGRLDVGSRTRLASRLQASIASGDCCDSTSPEGSGQGTGRENPQAGRYLMRYPILIEQGTGTSAFRYSDAVVRIGR